MSLEFPQNYFDLFQLPCALDVDAEQLTERYRALQRELHPDRFAAAGDQERRLAAQAAAHVNQAYRVLRDVHERATYLLQLQGIEIDDEKDTASDAEFLMRQMELREAMDEIQNYSGVEDFAARLAEDADALWQEFALRQSEARWAEAREVLLKLRFYRRLQQHLQTLRERFAAD